MRPMVGATACLVAVIVVATLLRPNGESRGLCAVFASSGQTLLVEGAPRWGVAEHMIHATYQDNRIKLYWLQSRSASLFIGKSSKVSDTESEPQRISCTTTPPRCTFRGLEMQVTALEGDSGPPIEHPTADVYSLVEMCIPSKQLLECDMYEYTLISVGNGYFSSCSSRSAIFISGKSVFSFTELM